MKMMDRTILRTRKSEESTEIERESRSAKCRQNRQERGWPEYWKIPTNDGRAEAGWIRQRKSEKGDRTVWREMGEASKAAKESRLDVACLQV
jgi:hypothetical protein